MQLHQCERLPKPCVRPSAIDVALEFWFGHTQVRRHSFGPLFIEARKWRGNGDFVCGWRGAQLADLRSGAARQATSESCAGGE